MLREIGMLAYASISTSFNFSKRVSLNDEGILPYPTSYKRLIGKLIYLTNKRPYITYVIHSLNQHVFASTTVHHQATFHTLRYLKQNLGEGIFLAVDGVIQLNGFYDSNWASSPKTRMSLSGHIIYIGHSSITQKSKK